MKLLAPSFAALFFAQTIIFLYPCLAQTDAGHAEKVQAVVGTGDFNADQQVIKFSPIKGESKDISTKDGIQIRSIDGKMLVVNKLGGINYFQGNGPEISNRIKIEDYDKPPGFGPSLTNIVNGATNTLSTVLLERENQRPLILLKRDQTVELINNNLGETIINIHVKPASNY